MFLAMRFDASILELVDQRYLPHSIKWVKCHNAEQVAVSIETMVVRGAPAIGCAAAFGVALEAIDFSQTAGRTKRDFANGFEACLARLARTRPTAVNLFYALDRMRLCLNQLPDTLGMDKIAPALVGEAIKQYDHDFSTCRKIGANGAAIFARAPRSLTCITHCNAGSLATAGYGTALGVIRALHAQKKIAHVYADETRPWLQGSRLTMFELKEENIPSTVICDSAAAFLMTRQKIDFVVVGADRIAANGDTANKIGTYSLAIAAARHGVPFYVAAPLSTFDTSLKDGSKIPIELRSKEEITQFRNSEIAPNGSEAWNPSFDVTPADLIAGIITEQGIATAPYIDSLVRLGS